MPSDYQPQEASGHSSPILPCNQILLKDVMHMVTLHVSLFSDSKFNPENRPGLWFSPETDSHREQ